MATTLKVQVTNRTFSRGARRENEGVRERGKEVEREGGREGGKY